MPRLLQPMSGNTEPRVLVGADGAAVLVDGGLEMLVNPDGDGWWVVSNNRTQQKVRTETTDIVELLWFCARNSHPPWVVCELVDSTTIRVVLGETECHIEADSEQALRQAVLFYLETATAELDRGVHSGSSS